MHSKPSTDDVRNRWETDLTATQLNVLIDDAAAFVDEHLGGQGVGDDTLERITAYVTIHFGQIRDPEAASIGVGRDRVEYQDTGGDGNLSGTWAGKRAIALDPTGILAAKDRDEGFRFVFRASSR